jgi:Ca2+-transporting ATPase
MAVLVGFILAFVGSSMFRIAGAALFNPLQILWVNFLIDAPIAVALGRDSATPGLMARKPRPANENIINQRLGIRLTLAGMFMAVITLGVYQWAQTTYGSATVAQTMALITFSTSHLFVALNLRYPYTTIFRMETLANRGLLYAYGFVILMMILATELPLMQRIFSTTALTSQQWGVCLLVAALTLVVAEIIKFIYRLARRD